MLIKNIFLLISFWGISTVGFCSNKILQNALNDTPKIIAFNLQSFVDARINYINSYNSTIYRKVKLADTIEGTEKRITYLINLEQNIKSAIKKVCSKLNLNSNNENIVYDSLINNFKEIINLENERNSLSKAKNDSLKQLKLVENQIASRQEKYQKCIEEIIDKTDTLNGSQELLYNGKKYLLYFLNNSKNEVRIIGSPLKGSTSIANTLKNSKETPLMITNAGMFQPNFKPQGLLISNFKKENEVDSSKEKKAGNFYLYPNGIFFIDSANKYHIVTTLDYLKNKYSNNFIKYATQSGPLLLNNYTLNPNIKELSSNLNIRSGIGVISSNKAVFVISLGEVNFYDFKMIFTTLGCKSALYLDGAISKIYINDKYPQRANIIPGNDHDFGPMISIFPKK